MSAPRMISLQRQLECVRREIALRKRVYPRWVANERMSEAKAAEEIATMEAVAQTLEQLALTTPGSLC